MLPLELMERRSRVGKIGYSILAFTLVTVLFTMLLPAYGSDLDELRRQQEKISQEIKRQKEMLQDKENKAKSLSAQVEELENRIQQTQSDLAYIERKLETAKLKVTEAEKELRATEDALAVRTQVFKRRLKEIYQNGKVEFVEVLLQSTDFTDFLVRFELLQRIARQDMRMLEEIEAERQRMEEKKADLEDKRDRVIALKEETLAKQKQLQEEKEKQEVLLAAVRSEKELLAKALAEKEEDSKKLAKKIRELEAQRRKELVSRGVGKLAWPTPGYTRVTSDYGWRIHPILKIKRMHNGIDIAAPIGATVVAAEDGVVLFTGWYGGYGKTVVIGHGNGISTMYPHLSSYQVTEGQNVRRGQAIAKVGNTGLSTGPHLHFEVRINGEPTNPWPYLR